MAITFVLRKILTHTMSTNTQVLCTGRPAGSPKARPSNKNIICRGRVLTDCMVPSFTMTFTKVKCYYSVTNITYCSHYSMVKLIIRLGGVVQNWEVIHSFFVSQEDFSLYK